MALRIRWSKPGIQSFEDICLYIEQFSQHYARLLAKEINLRIRRLPEHTLMGRMVLEFPGKNYREVIFRDYRIIYRVKPEAVEIGLIWHGAESLKSLLLRSVGSTAHLRFRNVRQQNLTCCAPCNVTAL